MKYLLLDVAGTILYKPELVTKINETLNSFGHVIAVDKLKYNHKVLSEVIKFPDRTNADFYTSFNAELLYSLGIVPNEELLNAIFKSCSYLPWEKFEDTKVLNEIEIPIGIISNFNSSLKDKLNEYFGPIFSDIFVSEEIGISKPSTEFYKKALDKININPKDILYIGDSFKLDLKPARELGITSYVIDRDNIYPDNANIIRSLSELKKLIN
ncbi:HAD family hydrolase [Flavobacterium sp. ANB]|uniref:HAD family hydrolase n=1 Tax=unclassified Flavobacterium TaxID=196869 RepID=UPI0012B9FF92|nr:MULTISPECIES: HAD family hydrolase [unclassified Flavobacterium]MBF4517595.1 HAD family hydrolase [Flavobacterium sp. ANB]MTD70322.1 HAD-IA family hydrolase [Flavobacterium sp. LC2016-13]